MIPCWAVIAAVRGAEPSVERSAADRLCSVDCATVTWNLRAFVHAIVPDDAGDAQAIIGKNPAAAFCLRDPMFTRVAPSQNCRFVPEKRERKDFAWLIQALKTLD